MKHIAIKGIRIELTEALRNYVHQKLESLEKFIHPDAHLAVEIGKPSQHHKKGDDVFMAEITVDSQGNTYFVQTHEADLYVAIDRARDEISELIKQGKGKRQTLLRKGRMAIKQLMQRGFYGRKK